MPGRGQPAKATKFLQTQYFGVPHIKCSCLRSHYLLLRAGTAGHEHPLEATMHVLRCEDLLALAQPRGMASTSI